MRTLWIENAMEPLGTGTGSELRQPLGYTIVGGLALSQILTLFTTPVVYLYLDRLGSLRRLRSRSADIQTRERDDFHRSKNHGRELERTPLLWPTPKGQAAPG
jgi:hypothetical protein